MKIKPLRRPDNMDCTWTPWGEWACDLTCEDYDEIPPPPPGFPTTMHPCLNECPDGSEPGINPDNGRMECTTTTTTQPPTTTTTTTTLPPECTDNEHCIDHPNGECCGADGVCTLCCETSDDCTNSNWACCYEGNCIDCPILPCTPQLITACDSEDNQCGYPFGPCCETDSNLWPEGQTPPAPPNDGYCMPPCRDGVCAGEYQPEPGEPDEAWFYGCPEECDEEACCIDEQCFDNYNWLECESNGGTAQGSSTSCSQNPCFGGEDPPSDQPCCCCPVCYDDISEADCLANGCIPQGVGEICPGGPGGTEGCPITPCSPVPLMQQSGTQHMCVQSYQQDCNGWYFSSQEACLGGCEDVGTCCWREELWDKMGQCSENVPSSQCYDSYMGSGVSCEDLNWCQTTTTTQSTTTIAPGAAAAPNQTYVQLPDGSCVWMMCYPSWTCPFPQCNET